MRRLLVLADDLSGACEIAGIISRYGCNAEIQLVPDLESTADAIVIDLDTRQPDTTLMEAKTAAFIPQLRQHAEEFTVFKKVDSVFRGHILKEARHLLDVLNARRVFLLPANPETGRTIIDGIYYVNGEQLHTTVFSRDPHFPKTSSSIAAIIDYRDFPLSHIHIKGNRSVPDTGLLTADISSMDDLDYYTSLSDNRTLYCGGAQCFDSFVRNVLHRQPVKHQQAGAHPQGRHCLINGSTVKTDDEAEFLKAFGIKRFCLPGMIRDKTFTYNSSSFTQWIARIIDDTEEDTFLYFHVEQPIRQEQLISDGILHQLVQLAAQLLQHHENTAVHLLLTGGATASAVLRAAGETTLQVVSEHAQGVVTVVSNRDNNHFYTIKPGSYSWPEILFNRIATQ